MLKRIAVLVFMFSAFVLLAMAPMSAATTSENDQKAQVTVDVDVTVAVETPDFDDGTPGILPVTGNDDSSPMLIYVLLGIVALVVVVGGIALINRRSA